MFLSLLFKMLSRPLISIKIFSTTRPIYKHSHNKAKIRGTPIRRCCAVYMLVQREEKNVRKEARANEKANLARARVCSRECSAWSDARFFPGSYTYCSVASAAAARKISSANKWKIKVIFEATRARAVMPILLIFSWAAS